MQLQKSKYIAASFMAVASSILIHLMFAFFATTSRRDWNWETFRSFGSGDQLSYFAFALNSYAGKSTSVEPFTETGQTSYPNIYYVLVGQFAKFVDISPAAAWLVVGALAQALLVATIGITIVLFTKKPLLAVFAFVPLNVGTLAYVINQDMLWQMQSHAVLWGPFAMLYPLNGEGFGMMLAALAGLALVKVLKETDKYRQVVYLTIFGLLAGAIANVATYVFITTIYLLIYIVSADALMQQSKKSKWYTAITLLFTLIIIGPMVAETTSRLLVLVLGLTPALPGLIALLSKQGWKIAIPLVSLFAAAAPTLVSTAKGTLAKDAFLLYRSKSSANLGVDVPTAIIAGLPLIALLLTIMILARHLNQDRYFAFAGGAFATWIILSKNDTWGANQEPYRLWIDSYALVWIFATPIFLKLLYEWALKRRKSLEIRDKKSARVKLYETKKYRVHWSSVALTLVITGVSMLDGLAFQKGISATPLIQLDDSRSKAMQRLVLDNSDRLYLVDNCIDPSIFKAVTGARVASMNVGMAWPKMRDQIMNVNVQKGQGVFDFESANQAGIQFLAVDNSCDAMWLAQHRDLLELKNFTEYQDGSFTSYEIKY